IASSSAVRCRGTANTSLFWISSTELVKSLTASGSSLKVIMKNSSCGFAVLKTSTTASLARSILLAMLPLESKITPSETGASSLENVRISWDELPSNSWKLALSKPVTSRFIGSVIVTGTNTRSTSTFRGCTCVLIPVEEATRSDFGGSGGLSTSRGKTCTSFTSVCPNAGTLRNASTNRVRQSQSHIQFAVEGFLRSSGL